METTTTTTTTVPADLSTNRSHLKSSSFRLRSPSLNSVRLRRIFDLFDTNHDNLITVEELSRALILLGLDTNMDELDSIINSFIQPGNAGLTFDDFQALHRSIDDLFFHLDDLGNQAAGDEDHDEVTSCDSSKQEEADLTEAFNVFDLDGDGYISATELQAVLGKLGFAEASEMRRVKMMISSVDRNKDGLVDFMEFKEMMRNVIVLH
ncbi:calcium-binding protein CML42-like [Cynara cardunculus var. scolymus]|uniref:Calcium-binding EF-hand n=1 Tax=Cynara cardunculus var. scolymus TaxID=59895 RepID=A0A103XQA4_CYNCS|nr:calcium-binding protein CML42-like [Cynara cardunculus var. scolymus]KVH94937.1 Calcium-binding EF-hand [Cynara cardunculus var. scolymus]